MVLENLPPTLDAWLKPALVHWLAVVGALAAVGLIVGFVVLTALNGPGRAGDAIYRLLSGAVGDLLRISPRRVLALARLAIQESLRRRVLAGLLVFFAILSFALWFLDTTTSDPAKLYLSFVLTATTYLVLLMMLFLSAFSLPTDIKNHTIYTIVTKPVRPSEIVLGRIVGFAAVGTALLAIMGLVSYVFVVRSLKHTHDLSPRDLVAAGGGAQDALTGRTGLERNHRHQVAIGADGAGVTDVVQGHWHEVTGDKAGDDVRYVVGRPEGQFHARIPNYGKLQFFNSVGQPTDKGINVGNEWTYRSYIEGATQAAAKWTFEGVRSEDFPDGLRLNMTISVFRTYKGDIEKTVFGSYTLRNPRTKAQWTDNFFAKEFAIDEHTVPLALEDSSGKPLDLFKELVDDGRLEIELNCLDGGQYFGVARPDLYLLPREGSFEANFLKGYTSIWLQMLLVTAVGVMWSTFLNGAVAMLATAATIVPGLFVSWDWFEELASGKAIGGGSFEALLRIVTQQSIGTPLEESLTSTVVQWLDAINRFPLKVMTSLLPDFASLDDAAYVAQGFNIPGHVVLEQSLTVLGFIVPMFIVGFLCLKMREVAK
jgi:hypothetical protein